MHTLLSLYDGEGNLSVIELGYTSNTFQTESDKKVKEILLSQVLANIDNVLKDISMQHDIFLKRKDIT
tara:strand:+ start:1253 stop:1456 length:204 start_codon:yes stop_codon:yes gene_type:complete